MRILTDERSTWDEVSRFSPLMKTKFSGVGELASGISSGIERH